MCIEKRIYFHFLSSIIQLLLPLRLKKDYESEIIQDSGLEIKD